MSTLYYESSLAHHGIKGQKWGVRRTPEQLGHKRKLRDLTDFAINDNNYNHGKIYEVQTRDAMLPKGTLLYRVSNAENETKSGRKYVSFTPSDIRNYAAADEFHGRYQKEYTTNKDIKIAGSVTAFNTLLESNPKLANTKIKDTFRSDSDRDEYESVVGKCSSKTVKQTFESISKDSKMIANFLSAYGFSSNTNNIVTMHDTDVNRMYYQKLKEKGYDSVIDIEDALGPYGTEYPMILINHDSYDLTGNIDRSLDNNYSIALDNSHNNKRRIKKE